MFKKNVKKIFVLIMVCVMAFCTNTSAFASIKNESQWVIKKDNNNHIYLLNTKTREKIQEAIRFDEAGDIIHIDLTEYVNVLNNQVLIDTTSINSDKNFNSIITPQSQVEAMYTYTESYASVSNGTWQKVTPDVIGPTTITYGNSITITDSFSSNVNITADIKKVIKAGASFTWVNSTATAANFGASFVVDKGKTGYVRFSPSLNVTMGRLRTRLFQDGVCFSDKTVDATGFSPKELSNGIADGIYMLVTY